jgi:uncharacterized protein
MEAFELVIFGVIGFVMAVISGISGGGAAMITTPLGILLGLTPAQSVATGKFSGLSVTLGSLSGMRRGHDKISIRRVIPIMFLAFLIGLLSPGIISSLDNDIYRILIAILLLLMIPVLLIRKIGIRPHHPKLWQKYIGSFLLSLSLLLQGAFSTGLGTLVNIVLMSFFGMTATEANITKRWSALILNATIIAGILGSGLVVVDVVIVAMCSTLAGSYVGGRVAMIKGDSFIMNVTLLLVLASAIGLLFSA